MKHDFSSANVALSYVLRNLLEETLELIFNRWENLISFIILETSGTFSF